MFTFNLGYVYYTCNMKITTIKNYLTVNKIIIYGNQYKVIFHFNITPEDLTVI